MDSQATKGLADPLIGQVLGGAYELVRRIGRGGMGAVYEAKHIRLPKMFAIKHLQQGLAADPESLARFKREAEIASSLGSRHIVEVLDFNLMPDGTPYMVMELLRGEDLGKRLRQKGRLGRQETLYIFSQVVSALAAAHRSDIVHRDIKPENIFLCQADEGVLVKLLDFGLSKVRNAHGTLVTQSDSFLGTPAFMSPEQTTGMGKGTIDHRTDIYSLGAVIYQALTGELPFTGETLYALILAIMNTEPAPMRQYAPWLPAEVEQVIGRALAKDPRLRYQSVTEFWRALAAAFGERVKEGSGLQSLDTLGPAEAEPPLGTATIHVSQSLVLSSAPVGQAEEAFVTTSMRSAPAELTRRWGRIGAMVGAAALVVAIAISIGLVAHRPGPAVQPGGTAGPSSNVLMPGPIAGAPAGPTETKPTPKRTLEPTEILTPPQVSVTQPDRPERARPASTTRAQKQTAKRSGGGARKRTRSVSKPAAAPPEDARFIGDL